MSPRAVGWCVAAGCAVVGFSRVLILKNPQPGTMKVWLVIAVVVFAVSFVFPSQAPQQLNRR